MKKSVIFMITVIYLMSIFIVTLFGMKIRVDQFVIYMSDLQITNYDKIDKKGNKVAYIYIDDYEEYSTFQVKYEYKPENISYPDKIKFLIRDNVKVLNGEEITIATITEFGKVAFTRNGSVQVKVYATDGSGKTDYITITCLKKSTT